jgi:predicted RNA binding protein YcfA (HicA-like mRNA interferase family)
MTLPLLRGSAMVAALRRLGFRVAARTGGITTLLRRRDAVVVPENVTLTPTLVGAMLRQANVEPEELLKVVEREAA